LRITNCTFRNNKGECGGGLYNYSSSPTVTNCIFSDNTASLYGGGVYNDQVNSATEFTNCVFYDNKAEYYGGGMVNEDAWPTIINCTFSQNSTISEGGGGLHNYLSSSNPDIKNCIFWGNTAGNGVGHQIENYQSQPVPTISYCDIQDCNTGGVWDANLGTNVAGNIDADPCFAAPDANNYHLRYDSPCIDKGDPDFAGSNETDIDGEPRVINGRVDMGADEFYWSLADFNLDEIVNFIDYAMFANAWQTSLGDPDYNDIYDLADNNTIDYNDLALFCEQWLWQAAWTQPLGAMMMGQGWSQPMSQSRIQSLGLTEGLYPSALPKQPQTQITEPDIEEIIKWLEELWLTQDELRKMISPAEWQEFIERVKIRY